MTHKDEGPTPVEAVRVFKAQAFVKGGGGVTIRLPFDPADAWGRRDRYHVAGTIDDVTVRTTLLSDPEWHIALGRKSPSATGLADGQTVTVSIAPEGPQAGALAADVVEAFAGRPGAQAAFDGLATFYRKGWLRWIDATKRRPDLRAERIAKMIRLVEAGHKQPPR